VSASCAEIGRRLLAAGRAKDAVAALEGATPKKRTTRSDLDDDDLYGAGWHDPDAEWESVYIDALVATGEIEHAQQLRWAAFKDRLSVERLRSYLNALPDFDDVLAEERAMDHALRFRVYRLRCTSFTSGQRTDRLLSLTLPAMVRSTATSTTCSIRRRGGWRAPVRWRQLCFAVP
jgi:hypothetical protein